MHKFEASIQLKTKKHILIHQLYQLTKPKRRGIYHLKSKSQCQIEELTNMEKFIRNQKSLHISFS